jgi:uncharacterized repeat protein (TIGR02543 family)
MKKLMTIFLMTIVMMLVQTTSVSAVDRLVTMHYLNDDYSDYSFTCSDNTSMYAFNVPFSMNDNNTLLGWYTDQTFDTQVYMVDCSSVTEDTNYYALWDTVTYALYEDDFTTNSNIDVQGDAYYNNGSVILTDALTNLQGSIQAKDSFYFEDGFSIDFTFGLGSGSSISADGVYFTLGDGNQELSIGFDTYLNTGEVSDSFINVDYNNGGGFVDVGLYDLGTSYFPDNPVSMVYFDIMLRYNSSSQAFDLYIKNQDTGTNIHALSLTYDLSNLMNTPLDLVISAYTGAGYQVQTLESLIVSNQVYNYALEPITNQYTQVSSDMVQRIPLFYNDSDLFLDGQVAGLYNGQMRYSTDGISYSNYSNFAPISYSNAQDYWIEYNFRNDAGIYRTDTYRVNDFLLLDGMGGITSAVEYKQVTGYDTFAIEESTLLGSYSTQSDANAIVGGDFNNDGYGDFAAVNNSNGHLNAYINDTLGGFTATDLGLVSTSYVLEMRYADIDNDGYKDLMVSTYTTSQIMIAYGTSGGSFENLVLLSGATTGGTYNVDMIDYDYDGDMDFFIGNKDGSVSFIKNLGARVYDSVVTLSGTTSNIGIAVGDVNGDGYMDVVHGTTSLQIHYGQSDGSFSISADATVLKSYDSQNIYIEDQDQDGYGEIYTIASNSDQLAIVEFNGTSYSVQYQTLPTNKFYYNSARFIDFNQDGYFDIYTSYYSTGIAVLLSNGMQSWTLEVDYNTTSPNAVALSDIDGDTSLELIYTDSGSSSINTGLDISGSVLVDDTSYRALVEDPVLEGYTFDKWYQDDQLTIPFNMNQTITENTTIYAGYDVITATYTLNTQGGDTLSPVVVAYGDTISLPTPTKADSVFMGWYLEDTYITEFTDTTSDGNDVTLYAKWATIPAVVHYITSGSSVADTSLYVGQSIGEPTTSKEGYQFVGWYLEDTYDTQVSFPYTVADETTNLYAYFEAIPYTITYYDYDSSVIESYTRYIYDDLSSIVISDPERQGYTFIEWDTTLPSTMPSNDISLYATYSINQYKLSYYDYDGNLIQEEWLDYNSDLTSYAIPSDPIREGYSFNGWDTSLPSNMTANDIEIQASYTINQYKLSYYDYDGSLIQEEWLDYNSDLTSYVIPSDPIREGYSFNGWDTSLPSNMTATNLDITATYTINQYKLSYYDYDGSLIQEEWLDYNSDLTSYTLPSNPNREGYSFNGWDTSLPSNMTATNLDITATYTINQYKLSYYDYDGSLIQEEWLDYNSDLTSYAIPSEPTRQGYTFSEWDTSLPSHMPSNDIDIYAIYSINQYSIILFDIEGNSIDEVVFNYQENITGYTLPIDMEVEGYTFIGWDQALPETMPDGEINVYPIYETNQYTITFIGMDGVLILEETVYYNEDLSSFISPIQPLIDGYTENGWDTSLPSNMPAQDLIITAMYNINQYSIVYLDYNDNEILRVPCDFGDDLSNFVLPDIPSRNGYNFVEWDTYLPQEMPSNDIVIRPLYIPISVEVVFMYNNQEISVVITSDHHIESLPILEAPSGTMFVGWYTLPGGQGELIESIYDFDATQMRLYPYFVVNTEASTLEHAYASVHAMAFEDLENWVDTNTLVVDSNQDYMPVIGFIFVISVLALMLKKEWSGVIKDNE